MFRMMEIGKAKNESDVEYCANHEPITKPEGQKKFRSPSATRFPKLMVSLEPENWSWIREWYYGLVRKQLGGSDEVLLWFCM